MLKRAMIFTALMVLLSACLSYAQQAPLWETGQTTCYDSDGYIISCSGTGQDGDIKAGVAWPSPRFTDNGNSTVIDNLTGLVWSKDAKTPGPAACSPGGAKTWQGALNYVACLNANNYLGYTDWRLSNREELHSLSDFSHTGPALPSGHPFLNVQSGGYWSSTSSAGYPDDAWVVDMWYGYMYYGSKSNGVYYVWPVRSGQVGPLSPCTLFCLIISH